MRYLSLFPLAVCLAASPVGRDLKVVATAYCPCKICCGPHACGKTATGRSAHSLGIAVDPRVIPLHSHVRVPGYSAALVFADDTGGAIKGLHIDVRFQSHEEAVRWGRKVITITVEP